MQRSIKPISKTIILLVLCAGCYSLLPAQKIKVKNPGNNRDIQPAIQAAVNKAGNGARIILPAGTFILNKSVFINKFISIKGQGARKTILYRSPGTPDSILSKRDWLCMFNYDIRSAIPSNIVVSDIGFRGKKPSVVRGDGGSRSPTEGVRMVQCVDFLIEHCRFEYFANAGIYIIHNDTLARGLIRKNEFYYNAGAGLGYGIAVMGTNDKWINDPKLGSRNFIFVEDNLFDYHRHSMAAGGCALYVFRYNTVLNNIAGAGGHAVDTHEARKKGGGNTYGTRAIEVYNNKLLNTTYTDGTAIIEGEKMESLETAGIAVRAGDAVVFNNEVKGYQYAARISNWYLEGTIQSTYPINSAPGYLSGVALGPDHSGINSPEGDGDAFFWNNTDIPFVKGTSDSLTSFHNYEPSWWKEGRDYHLVPKPGYKPYTYPYPIKRNKSKG